MAQLDPRVSVRFRNWMVKFDNGIYLPAWLAQGYCKGPLPVLGARTGDYSAATFVCDPIKISAPRDYWQAQNSTQRFAFDSTKSRLRGYSYIHKSIMLGTFWDFSGAL